MVKKKNYMAVILTLCLAVLISTMNISIFNVALPALMAYFGAEISTVQWLSSGYLLAAGIVTPAVASLGNRFGYRRVLLLATMCSGILSVIGALSINIQMLIVVRIALGISAGMLMPLGMAMIYMLIPTYEQAKAAGIIGAFMIVGGALPTVLSGAIVTFLSWHYLMWLMVPFCILLVILIEKYLPNDAPMGKEKMDTVGFLLTGIGSFALLFSFSNLSEWGLTIKFFMGTLLGLAFLVAYIKLRWNKERAILNLEVLKYPRYCAALFVDVVFTMATYTATFVMPLFLQNGMHYSAALTGAMMLPTSIVTIAMMPIATKTLTGFGEKALAGIGCAILILGSLIFVHPTATMGAVIIIVGMCVRSAGIGFLSLLGTNTSMAAVPKELSGHASSLINWEKQMMGALTTGIASNVVGLRILSQNPQTVEEISQIYLSVTGVLMIVIIILLAIIPPVAIKFFRSKKEMIADGAIK